jgi:microcystin-dependent protein
MDQMFISAMAIFGFNFAPRNWAMCNGQTLSIASNTALFSLLGTTYGGNGTTTFALPNLQSRVPIGQGQGPGLSNYVLGQAGGEVNHTITSGELPAHNHPFNVNNAIANLATPNSGSAIGIATDINGDAQMLYNTLVPNIVLSANAVGVSGGGQAHNNQQPYLGLNICICLFGIFPSRN